MDDKLTPVDCVEQIVSKVGVALATGVGFTVITTVNGVPGQPFADGVTVYVTVWFVIAVDVNACAIVEPLPALAPVIEPGATTVHVNVVPLTVLLNAILVGVALQITSELGVAVPVGIGFTVLCTLYTSPKHAFAGLGPVGVTL